ncbi:zinc finger a20 domain-containing protein 3 [Lynx pardinus]|uniref:Zinc finger a20 domain-containing protein 3 n=1 Tax=Lynx pardinus TaxID=191816 RepID=A0A485MW84_LYNPA|nr:zinc finger a20 domain-containing protein 3 [Lynx pardinus]
MQLPLDSTCASGQPNPVSNKSLLSESVASSQVDSMWTKQSLTRKTCKLQYQIWHSSHLKSKASLVKNQNRKRTAVSCAGRKEDLLGLNAGVIMCIVVYTVTQTCTIARTITKLMLRRKSEKKNSVVGEKIQKI